jgi:septal ring factor EnvC (AmiA/AmiB activator)
VAGNTCRVCGAPLSLTEHRYCTRCWNTHWNRLLNDVDVQIILPDERFDVDEFTNSLEDLSNDMVAIVAELTAANDELKRENEALCRTNDHQDEVIRRQQATIDELNEVMKEQADYTAYLEAKLEQERARADGLQERLDGLSATLFAENRLLAPRLAKWNGKDGKPLA